MHRQAPTKAVASTRAQSKQKKPTALNNKRTKRTITTRRQSTKALRSTTLSQHTSQPITSRTTTLAAKRRYAFQATPEFDVNIQYKFLNGRKVSLVGVPFAYGQPLQGVDKAPQDMRKGGLIERMTNENWEVLDHGDIPVEAVQAEAETRTEPDGVTPHLKSAEIVSKVCHDTALATSKHSAEGNFMLTLGGDHSIAMGSIAGILKSRPNTGVIWVDAHSDINTPLTTPSGNIHGMPVSFLMKHPHCQNIATFEWLKEYPALDPRKIVYIGLRDLENGERRIIKEYGIKAFTMQDVDRHGIGAVVDKAIRHLTNDRRLDIPLHLSMDIDGVDPLFAPSTGTRVFGGLYYREAYYICEALAETGLLASMDLVEVNPSLGETPDAAERTVKIANGLIASALGNRIL